MGKIICEKHGGQGIVFTCPHVCQDIQKGTTTIDCLVTSTHDVGTIGDHVISIELGCCINCAKPYQAALLEEIETDTPSESGDQTKPVCRECFDVFRETIRPCDSKGNL
jgi:hypothetical protein